MFSHFFLIFRTYLTALMGWGIVLGPLLPYRAPDFLHLRKIEFPFFRHDSFQCNPYLCGVLEWQCPVSSDTISFSYAVAQPLLGPSSPFLARKWRRPSCLQPVRTGHLYGLHTDLGRSWGPIPPSDDAAQGCAEGNFKVSSKTCLLSYGQWNHFGFILQNISSWLTSERYLHILIALQ
jgi:hypothetical protein